MPYFKPQLTTVPPSPKLIKVLSLAVSLEATKPFSSRILPLRFLLRHEKQTQKSGGFF